MRGSNAHHTITRTGRARIQRMAIAAILDAVGAAMTSLDARWIATSDWPANFVRRSGTDGFRRALHLSLKAHPNRTLDRARLTVGSHRIERYAGHERRLSQKARRAPTMWLGGMHQKRVAQVHRARCATKGRVHVEGVCSEHPVASHGRRRHASARSRSKAWSTRTKPSMTNPSICTAESMGWRGISGSAVGNGECPVAAVDRVCPHPPCASCLRGSSRAVVAVDSPDEPLHKTTRLLRAAPTRQRDCPWVSSVAPTRTVAIQTHAKRGVDT